MKTRHLRSLHAALAALTMLPAALEAASFAYSPGDLLLTFRQSGNASDLVVNVGKAATFDSLPPGTTIPVTALAASQVSSAFPSINGVNWSVAGANRPPADPKYPVQTLWVSRPREIPTSQSLPWLRKGVYYQGTAGGQIAGLGANTVSASSLLPAGPDNDGTGVVIPSTGDFSVSPLLGDGGDFAGTFQGAVEASTPADFDSDPSSVSRVDLYELLPGSTAAGTLNNPGRYLGYFELKPDASLTFNTLLPTPALPTISPIADQTTDEDTPTVAIGFTVGDSETAANDLVVTATSSDTSVVAPGGISLGGTGASRTITLTPVPNASGTTTITVTVADSANVTTSASFVLTVKAVNVLPTAATIVRDGNATTISFETVRGFVYVVRAVEDLTLGGSVGTWKTISTISGDGSIKAVEDVSGSPSKYFVVETVRP